MLIRDKASQCADAAATGDLAKVLHVDITQIPDGARYTSATDKFGDGFRQVVVSVNPSGRANVESNITLRPTSRVLGLGNAPEIYQAVVGLPAPSQGITTEPQFAVLNKRPDSPVVSDVRNAAVETARRTADQFQRCVRESGMARFFRTAREFVPFGG